MKNAIFSRSTRECRFNEMDPVLANAFREVFLNDKFSGTESKIITCFETISLRKKLFSTKTEYGGVILTPDVLFWGMVGNKCPGAAAALLKEIVEINDYEKREEYNIMKDNGLYIFGFIYKASRRSSWFVGLGDDKDGEKCRRLLRDLFANQGEKKVTEDNKI